VQPSVDTRNTHDDQNYNPCYDEIIVKVNDCMMTSIDGSVMVDRCSILCDVCAQEVISRQKVKAYIGFHSVTWRGEAGERKEQLAWATKKDRNPTYMQRDDRGNLRRFTSRKQLEDRGMKTAVTQPSTFHAVS
jgi:hypothetical protein